MAAARWRMWAWLLLGLGAGCAYQPDEDPTVAWHLAPAEAGVALACTYTDGVATVTVPAGVEAVVSRGAADGTLRLNGRTCPAGAGRLVLVKGRGANTAKRLRLEVGEGARVVMDYEAGTLLPGYGSPAVAGVEVDSDGAAWTLEVRGRSGADAFTLGAAGFAFDGNALRDLTWARTPDSAILTGLGGADQLFAIGDVPRRVRGVGAAFPGPVTLLGGDGPDQLAGGDEADTLDGGAGNDRLLVYPTAETDVTADGPDVMRGGDGRDIVDYSRRLESVIATTSGAWVPIPYGDAGARDEVACVTPEAPTAVWAVRDAAPPAGVTQPQRDARRGDGRIVFTSCTTGCDPLTDAWQSEQDDIGADVERVIGSAARDWLYGGCGAEVLAGGKGADVLYGGAGGDDELRGEAGDDLLDAGSAEDGRDRLLGGPGVDTVDYRRRTDGVRVSLDGRANDGGREDVFNATLTLQEADNVVGDVEVLYATDAADWIAGSAGMNRVWAGGGDDVVAGGGGNDALFGQDGDDVLSGGPGSDTLTGGRGSDALSGDAGDDSLQGERGRWCDGRETTKCTADGDCGEGGRCIWDEACPEGATCDDVVDGGVGKDYVEASWDPGADVLKCDLGVDLVSYKLRRSPVTVTRLDGLPNDGDPVMDRSGERLDYVSGTCEGVQVPEAPSPAMTSVEAAPLSVLTGDEVTLTLTLRGADGSQLLQRGASVVLGVVPGDVGGLLSDGEVTERGDGVYTATYVSLEPGSARVTATLNGATVTSPMPTLTIGGRPCTSAAQCGSGVCGGDGVCAAPTCTDAVRNGGESDADCGGWVCAPCAEGRRCERDAECVTLVCADGLCAAPTCTDGVRNGVETGVDCGNGCPACPAGQGCGTDTDCDSLRCVAEICAAPTCADGVRNGGEPATDCGASCPVGCADGEACAVGPDCASGVCTDGTCAAARCDDAARNGVETDVDCGGGSCATCADGRACEGDSDCTSGVCNVAKMCVAVGCGDGRRGGDETDVDCGGACAGCAIGQACGGGADCASASCVDSLCAAPTCDDSLRNGAETDVDCGGGTCGGCGSGAACAVGRDCLSEVCQDRVCQGGCMTLGCAECNGSETPGCKSCARDVLLQPKTDGETSWDECQVACDEGFERSADGLRCEESFGGFASGWVELCLPPRQADASGACVCPWPTSEDAAGGCRCPDGLCGDGDGGCSEAACAGACPSGCGCGEDGACASCDEGYAPDEAGGCAPCDGTCGDGCDLCDACAGACLVCAEGFEEDGAGGCEPRETGVAPAEGCPLPGWWSEGRGAWSRSPWLRALCWRGGAGMEWRWRGFRQSAWWSTDGWW